MARRHLGQGQAPARLGPSVGFGAGRTNTGYDGRGRGYRGGTAYVPFVPLGYGTYGAASTVVPQTTINQSVEANPVVVSIVNGGSGGSGPGVVPFRPICAGPKIISVAGARPASTGPLPRIVYGTQPDCIAADTTASARRQF